MISAPTSLAWQTSTCGSRSASAYGFAETDLGGAQWRDVEFTGPEIAARAVKTVQTRDVARATVATTLRNLDLDVRALGAGLGTNADRLCSPPPRRSTA